MKLLALAYAACPVLLFAVVQLQYGPQWKLDAAVEEAIAVGDLKHARRIAVTAEHWRQIVESSEARFRHSALDNLTLRASDGDSEKQASEL